MDGLLPIVRRVRRPLVDLTERPQDHRTARPQDVVVPVGPALGVAPVTGGAEETEAGPGTEPTRVVAATDGPGAPTAPARRKRH